MTNTQDALLDAAERLFVERGFAATSLRSIASRAEANLAATNYHFGSKQGLLAAVVHRRVTPINKARLAALDRLEHSGNRDLRAIIEAFLNPIVESDERQFLPALIGRIYSEPPSVSKPLLENEFGEVANRFTHALNRLLPEVPLEDIRWRFHFMVGAMLQTLTVAQPISSGDCPSDRQDIHEKFEKLIQFSVAGMSAPIHSSGEKS